MPGSVLICDDNEVMRSLLRETLVGRGYAIAEAQDGDESIELARKMRPDLIVLDLMMPGQSGLDVLAILRDEPGLAETPVVLLTAAQRAFDRVGTDVFGADRYLVKPFSPIELLSVV